MDMVPGFKTPGRGMRCAATSDARPELADPKARTQLVGLGFKVVEAVFLMEVGDEFLDLEGQFRTVPLDCVGREAPLGALVRRLERRVR